MTDKQKEPAYTTHSEDEKKKSSVTSKIQEMIKRLGRRSRSETLNTVKPDELSRRDFLKLSTKIGAGVAFHAFSGDLPLPSATMEEIAQPDLLLKMDMETLPTANEFIANRSEFQDVFATYFSNQLKQTQYLISKQLLLSALQKSSDAVELDVLLISTQKEELLRKKDQVIRVLESNEKDPKDIDATVREVLDLCYTHPQSVAQILYDIEDVESTFATLPQIDQQVCFRCKPIHQNLLKPVGYFPERFDYRASKPLEKYEPDDSVETYEVLPQIQECIEHAEQVFGVSAAAITAILVIEGGGGVNGPGTTLAPSVQEEILKNNFNMPKNLQLRNPYSGAAGPGQAMKGTINTFRHAVEILWPGEDPANVDNIKHAIALIAAKLYIDSLVLFYAERYRYTPKYQSERDRQINEFYPAVTNGMSVAEDKSGLENVLKEFGPLKPNDDVFTFHASVDYYGTDEEEPRLGNRGYDEYIAAYRNGLQRQRPSNRVLPNIP